jgi:NAD(P)H-hydrate repair Nnr-like enzyme with NAD(P)H-hydrate dehydratase domain
VPAKEIDADPNRFALETARRFKVTVLLKGNQTVVANSNRVIQLPAAPSWLATAGTGDVLAGILGALLALNHQLANHENLIEIGATASFIHAKAAEESSEGPLNLVNVIDCISKVVRKLIK